MTPTSMYYIDYYDNYGNIFHVQCEAKTPEAAEAFVKHWYWNIDTIIQIYKKH